MDTYTLLRQIADSWVLLAMFLFFVGAVIWAFLPSQSAARDDARMIPMRDDAGGRACGNDCTTCGCASSGRNWEGADHG